MSGPTRTRSSQLPASVESVPSLAEAATLYVSTDGNDANNGLSWKTAFLTIQAAIAAAPVHGAVIEVGYGDFTITTPITITGTQRSLRIRGRNQGTSPDGLSATFTPPTRIVNNNVAGGDAIQINSVHNTGQSVGYGLIIEDISVVGSASSGNGITVAFAPRLTLRRVNITGHGVFGLDISDTYYLNLDHVYCLLNGTAGATGATGGLKISTPTAVQDNLWRVNDCIFNQNHGDGVYVETGIAINFVSTDFSFNLKSARANSGNGLLIANGAGGGPFNFYGSWFENNPASGINSTGLGGQIINCDGCYFVGYSLAGSQQYGIGASSYTTIKACSFTGHWVASIDNRWQNAITWTACHSTDTTFMRNVSNNTANNLPAAAAASSGTYGQAPIHGRNLQTLAANGAVTINAAIAETQVITLAANASSSSITNPGGPGQRLVIQWVQDATGSRTYVWPANCKFAGGAAPTASTTAAYIDAVEFEFDGTNWNELNRSVAIH